MTTFKSGGDQTLTSQYKFMPMLMWQKYHICWIIIMFIESQTVTAYGFKTSHSRTASSESQINVQYLSSHT